MTLFTLFYVLIFQQDTVVSLQTFHNKVLKVTLRILLFHRKTSEEWSMVVLSQGSCFGEVCSFVLTSLWQSANNLLQWLCRLTQHFLQAPKEVFKWEAYYEGHHTFWHLAWGALIHACCMSLVLFHKACCSDQQREPKFCVHSLQGQHTGTHSVGWWCQLKAAWSCCTLELVQGILSWLVQCTRGTAWI